MSHSKSRCAIPNAFGNTHRPNSSRRMAFGTMVN
jgi:hypothetical protein